MSDVKYQLEESHKDLYQWFLLHQESLLLGNDYFAQQAFEIFSLLLNSHVQFENEFLLSPQQQQEIALQWPIALYQKEHEKILLLLANLQRNVARYFLLSGREKRLTLLDILAKEQTFRNVMEHHETREEKDLFLHLHSTESLLLKWNAINIPLQERFFSDKEKIKNYLANA